MCLNVFGEKQLNKNAILYYNYKSDAFLSYDVFI